MKTTKDVHFIAGCRKDIKKLPEEVQHEIGFALYLAQRGEKAVNAVPLLGFGSSKVLEVIIDESGDTYRAIYTVKFAMAVYALHAFQKKSRRGGKTPKPDVALIRSRLKLAEADYKARYTNAEKKDAAG